MVSVLDDEYVLEMDEVPPFSWLSKSHERVMHCTIPESNDTVIHAIGNAFTYSLISRNSSNRKYEMDEFFVNRSDALHIIISTSGDEENSVRFLETMNKRCVAISSGGKLKKIAREKNFDFISLPKGMPSRFLYPEIIGCLSGNQNLENYYELGEKISKLSPSSLTEENLAKTVALELKDKIPVIVYDYSSYAIARKLQEDLLQNSNLFSILISYNQVKMINNIGDNYKVIEIAEHRMKGFDSSIFLQFKGGFDSLIFLSTLTSYISLYSALLRGYDFYLFDILKE